MDTRNILFICGGAFPDLPDIIKERLNKQSSIGFQADLKDKYDEDKNLLMQVTVEDLRNFGMIPEFFGKASHRFRPGKPDGGYAGADPSGAEKRHPQAVPPAAGDG